MSQEYVLGRSLVYGLDILYPGALRRYDPDGNGYVDIFPTPDLAERAIWDFHQRHPQPAPDPDVIV
jgi:hypothetical protein